MKKAALIIIVFTLFSKLFGFLRDIVLSYVYGASSISDAYLIAYTIPGVIFAFIGTGIATSFIPLYSKIENAKGIKEADKFTNRILVILMLVSSAVITLGWFLSYPLVKVFAMGFDQKTLELAVSFNKISMFGIFFSVVIHVLMAYLNLKKNFHIPALVGIPFNLVIIISIILSERISLLILPLGIIGALISQLIIIAIYVYKENFRFTLFVEIKDSKVKQFFLLSTPVILGVAVNQINILIDRSIASTIAIGGVSALNYANRLNEFIQGIFVMSIVTAMYPLISKMSVDRNIKGLIDTLQKAIIGISLLVLPATVYFVFFAENIVTILFGRGEFDAEAIKLTSSSLIFYSLGMIGIGLREVISRVFYSMQDTKTPMINAALGMIINMVLNIILSEYMGISGLALATSIAAIFTTILLLVSLKKKIGSYGLKSISAALIKITGSSLIMGIITNTCYSLFGNVFNQTFAFLIISFIGIVIYTLFIYFLRIQEVDMLINTLKRKLNKI